MAIEITPDKVTKDNIYVNGLSVIWGGYWSSTKTYRKNLAISYLGSSYRANKTTTQVPSSDSVDWDVLALGSTVGEGSQQSSNLKVTNHSSDYTLVSTDNNSVVIITTSIPTFLTLPNNLSLGFQCFVIQGGAGTVQYTTGTGATLKSFTGHQKLAGINSVLHLAVLSNSDGSSAKWQVIKADSVAGAIAALPLNFNLVFGHDFSNSNNLTVSGTDINSVAGKGSSAFTISKTAANGQNYPSTLITRPSGIKESKGGGLSSISGPNLSTYGDFTQIFLATHTYSSGTLLATNIFGDYLDSSSSFTSCFLNSWGNESGVLYLNLNSGVTSIGSRHCWEDKNVHLVVFTKIGTTLSIYVDGVIAGSGTEVLPLAGQGISYSLMQQNGNSYASGNMALLDAGFYSRGLSAEEVAQLDLYYNAAFPNDYKSTALKSKNLWVYNSNSIGKGYQNGNANTPSAQMVKVLAASYSKVIDRWYNISLAGISTIQMGIDAPVYLDPFWGECTGVSNLIIHEGTNDIYLNNITGTQAYNNLKAYWLARKAAGCTRVFVGTILPRTDYSSDQNTARTTCNKRTTFSYFLKASLVTLAIEIFTP
ncbi:SGNH/GDSL hydrolase family protein [Nostoc sp. NMS8]|uniref:SGNH/GDSL hydrolase family protein n=1 Tax=Nostoc sp. NMS8 TaxID=2815392 RepID=UPI0025E39188|nr:SGNH/GDSL hydrolase family protein [Nostoc sp. NMS8]MBN3962252.1 SGNH/GDSL hydrolase family protein [Nostoc sp. NMS8]